MVDLSVASRLIATASAALDRDAPDFETLASVDMAMCVSDARATDMPIVYANPSFAALTGYAEHEIAGRNCRFLQGANTDASDVQRFRDGLTLQRPFRVEILNYRKDGSSFANQVFVTPLRDRTGIVTHFLGMQVPVDIPAKPDSGDGLAGSDARNRDVRQLMQTLTSLVSLQARRARHPAARQALEDVIARFEALAVSHDSAQAADLPDYLGRLLPRVAAIYDPRSRISVETALAPARLAGNRLAVVGQIATELLIEAYHEAGARDGSAAVSVSCGVDADGVLELSVGCRTGDTGGTPVFDGRTNDEFSTAMLESLVRGLEGGVQRATGEQYAVRVRIPMA